MTPNHLRRLNRREASPTSLAPILLLGAISIVVLTWIIGFVAGEFCSVILYLCLDEYMKTFSGLAVFSVVYLDGRTDRPS